MSGAVAASQMLSGGKLGAITAPFDRNKVSSIIFISVFYPMERLIIWHLFVLKYKHNEIPNDERGSTLRRKCWLILSFH